MTSVQLHQWIEHPESLNQESLYELRLMVARYPYFQSLRLLYLKNLYLLHDSTFGAELRKSVLYVADPRVLFYLIEGERYALRPHPSSAACGEGADEKPGMDRTLFLIDSFLSKMPDESSASVALDYSMDYTAYLLKEDDDGGKEAAEVPKLRGHELIDDFLSKEETPTAAEAQTILPAAEGETSLPPADSVEHPAETSAEVVEETEEEGANEEALVAGDLDDSYFTETLAKIYVKQHRYDKALEIIKKLSLNYPKKNAYFADQIRFLEKLIINAKSK